MHASHNRVPAIMVNLHLVKAGNIAGNIYSKNLLKLIRSWAECEHAFLNRVPAIKVNLHLVKVGNLYQ